MMTENSDAKPEHGKPEHGKPDVPGNPDSVNNRLGRVLRNEVPAAGPHYFNRMDETIARLAQERDAGVIPIDRAAQSEVTTTYASDFEIVNTGGTADRQMSMTTIQDTPGWHDAVEPRGLRWLNLGSVAAMFAIVGLAVSAFLIFQSNPSGRVEVSSNPDAVAQADGQPAAASTGDGVGPVMNRDHWHAPYGVYSCAETYNGIDGGWLPKFEGTADPLGIHSHQDGVIHIHPFFEESAGENAQFHVFIDSMGATLTDNELTLPDGRVLRTGDDCNGEPAQLHIRKWQFDFLRDDTAPELITENLGATRFVNDREVWQLVHAPLDADIGQLPSERFAALDSFAGALELQLPEGLAPGEIITELWTLEIIPDEVRNVCEVDVPSGASFAITGVETDPGVLSPAVGRDVDDVNVVEPGVNSNFDTLGSVRVLSGGAHFGDAGIAYVEEGGVLGSIGQHGDAGRGIFYEPGAIIAAQPSLDGPIIQCGEIVPDITGPVTPSSLGADRPVDLTLGSGVNDRPWIEMSDEAALSSLVFSESSSVCIDRFAIDMLGIHNSQPIDAEITIVEEAGESQVWARWVNGVSPGSGRIHSVTYPSDTQSHAYGRSTDVVGDFCVPVSESGTWTVTVELDPDNVIAEIDETNNVKSRTFEISGT